MMQFFKSLPPWARGVVIILIIVILVTIGIYTKNAIQKALGDKDAKAEAKYAGDEVDRLANEGIHPTFNNVEAQTKVNAMVEAANGCDGAGQGAQVIMQIVYSMQNAADWNLMLNTFGVKTWDDCGWGTGDVTGSMTTLFISELDSPQLAEVRRHIGQFNVSF